MKANRGLRIDRISNLPSNVIDGILRHLPIRDVIRTSILSRKWRHMWVSVPRLEFGLDFFDVCYDKNIEDPAIPSIIRDSYAPQWSVSTLTLQIPNWYTCEIACLSKWILFLSKSGITYLERLNCGSHQYEMSSHLFSCQGLTSLKLGLFELSRPPKFRGFKSLLELHLIEIRFESGALERLISGCPVLNMLTISRCFGFDRINVSTPSLKVLCIESRLDIKSICFKKAKNLTDLTLIMENHMENSEQISISDFIDGLPKIERLCLRGEHYIEILSTGIIMETLQKSPNLKYLELDGVDFNQSRDILSIVSLLKSSSILGELVIKSSSVGEAPLPDYMRELYCNSCCLSQLQKVNITVGTAYEHALDLIRFLLANSSSLEILTFEVCLGLEQSGTSTLLSISRDLLQMGRASQRAEVKLLDDGFAEQ